MVNETLKNYFRIKDTCRYGLIKYLDDALSRIPKINSPKILDMGCGTGVTTIFLAEYTGGTVYAFDIDSSCISFLKEKIENQNLSDRISADINSVSNLDFETNTFDIILAEGLLNIIGFEKGLSIAKEYLKNNAYFIIHDELKNHIEKTTLINRHSFELIYYSELDENIWWNDYYKCLENQINSCNDQTLLELFQSDLNEIEMFKKDSSPFKSVYYILQNS
jgi:ubiquinone/menaquinone biosynthesis C-methylase UbiE